jgi:putative Holliday junction resolvase
VFNFAYIKYEKVLGRIMALDYGTKRVGIAVTDTLQLIASGLTTVHVKDLVVFLKEYVKKENVECIVVGLPKNTNNTPSDVERHITPLVTHLNRLFPDLRIDREDERFTSKMAFHTMIEAGLKKKDRSNKALVDQTSATIILQSYLERKTKT